MTTDYTMQEEENAAIAEREVKIAMRPKRGKMSMKSKVILIIVSLLLMGVLRTGFMFVIIGVLPSVVAYYIDITTERYTFKTIFACNLCGMLPYIEKMLHNGPSSATLQAVMGNASNWMIIYGSAIIGWLLVEICPMIAQFLVHGFHQTQTGRIAKTQKKIEGEWGPEVVQIHTESKAQYDYD